LEGLAAGQWLLKGRAVRERLTAKIQYKTSHVNIDFFDRESKLHHLSPGGTLSPFSEIGPPPL